MADDKTRLKRGHHGLYTLWLHDEAPRIGSGNRVVDVAIGNHKVKLTCPFTGRTARIARATFDEVWDGTMNQTERR